MGKAEHNKEGCSSTDKLTNWNDTVMHPITIITKTLQHDKMFSLGWKKT